jgi:hypothetical protein
MGMPTSSDRASYTKWATLSGRRRRLVWRKAKARDLGPRASPASAPDRRSRRARRDVSGRRGATADSAYESWSAGLPCGPG